MTADLATDLNHKAEVFHLILIRPTHYDAEGYLLQWRHSYIPANTLACLNGIAEDCRAREVLGEAVDLRIRAIDETNRRVRPDKLIAMIRRDGARALIGLVGVQSNQYPRAVDLAQPFLEAGIPVCIGGFHASGSLAMLDGTPPEIAAAQAWASASSSARWRAAGSMRCCVTPMPAP